MPPEAYTAGADVIKNINSELQLYGLVIVGVFVIVALWIMKLSRDSKALAVEKENNEIERTEHRTKQRDAQINGITARFDAEIKDMREDFNEHIKRHETEDNRLYERLGKIERNLSDNAIVLARIETILELNEKARAKEHERG